MTGMDKATMSSIKTLGEINYDFNRHLAEAEKSRNTVKAPCLPALRILSDILFYLAVLTILYSVLSVDISEGIPRNVLGYSCFTVMSSSMKDEIPKGSLVVVKETEPAKLTIGDNITYKRSSAAIVTHKIIGISDSEEPAERTFQTKGVNNANPDDYTVADSDVLGKVIFVMPGAGAYLGAISDNIHLVLAVFLLFSFLSFLLRGLSRKKRGSSHEK